MLNNVLICRLPIRVLPVARVSIRSISQIHSKVVSPRTAQLTLGPILRSYPVARQSHTTKISRRRRKSTMKHGGAVSFVVVQTKKMSFSCAITATTPITHTVSTLTVSLKATGSVRTVSISPTSIPPEISRHLDVGHVQPFRRHGVDG